MSIDEILQIDEEAAAAAHQKSAATRAGFSPLPVPTLPFRKIRLGGHFL